MRGRKPFRIASTSRRRSRSREHNDHRSYRESNKRSTRRSTSKRKVERTTSGSRSSRNIIRERSPSIWNKSYERYGRSFRDVIVNNRERSNRNERSSSKSSSDSIDITPATKTLERDNSNVRSIERSPNKSTRQDLERNGNQLIEYIKQ